MFNFLVFFTLFTLTLSQETSTTGNPLQNFPPPRTLQELGIQLKTLVVNFNNDNFYELLSFISPRTEMCIQNLKMNFTKVFRPQIDSVVGLINATIQALPKELYQKAQYIPDQISSHLMILLDPDVRNSSGTTQKSFDGQIEKYTTRGYQSIQNKGSQSQNSQTQAQNPQTQTQYGQNTQNTVSYRNQGQNYLQSYPNSVQSYQNSVNGRGY